MYLKRQGLERTIFIMSCWCQPMVIGISSIPTEIPNLGCGEEVNFIQCKELNRDTAQLWDSSIVLRLNYEATWLVKWPWTHAFVCLDCFALPWDELVCSSLLCSACSSLVWSGLVRCLSLVFQLQQGNTVFSLRWKGTVRSPSQREADSYRQKSLPLVPDWFILMQMKTLNLCSLINPKDSPHWPEWSHSDLWRKMLMRI